MRITILAIGTRGDVQPFVALGLGLRTSGHIVRIATHTTFKPLVCGRGLDFYPVAGDPRDLIETQPEGHGRDAFNSNGTFLWGIRRLAKSLMHERLRNCWEACQDTECIISSPLAVLAGYHIAEKLQVAFVRTSYGTVPGLIPPTRAFPSLSLPGLATLGGSLNSWTHRALGEFVWLWFRGLANSARRDVLNLPPISLRNPLSGLDDQGALFLICCSPVLLSRPTDWASWVSVTGFWFLDRPAGWRPPQDLVDFIQAGPPPVYVGFGSMPSRSPRDMTELVVRALQRSGQRGVLATGWRGLEAVENSEQFYFVDDVPHDWLFPQMAAVVHQGGAGTTGMALRSGSPSVVVPYLPEQKFWGTRIHELGVGLPSLRRGELSAEGLGTAIKVAVTDQQLHHRAAEISRIIQQEDGVGDAVEAIHRYISMGATSPFSASNGRRR